MRRSTVPNPYFRIPSPDLDKQAPYRVIHEILMPLNVNWVPHRRQNRDAGCPKRIPITGTGTSILYVTCTGERGDEAGPWGQVTVPASTQSSLHMARERLDAIRTSTLERKRKRKVEPPRGRMTNDSFIDNSIIGEEEGANYGERAYPPSMMPNEFAGETIQSHRSLSGGRLDNMPSSTVKWVCKFDGRVVMACVHAFTSDSEPARGAGEIRMKWGSSPSGFGIGIVVSSRSDLIRYPSSPII
jgi:hypothetical protein